VYFLVPREISAEAATLWMAAVDEPGNAKLTLAEKPADNTPWQK
jgi:hypothetical protein